jgi:hypothetical protein
MRGSGINSGADCDPHSLMGTGSLSCVWLRLAHEELLKIAINYTYSAQMGILERIFL